MQNTAYLYLIEMKTITQGRRPCCRKCNIEFEERVRRGFVAKYVFFWLPLKRYICLNCLRRYYVLNTGNHSLEYGQDKQPGTASNIYRLSSSNTGQ